VKASEKRNGNGRGNWGAEGDQGVAGEETDAYERNDGDGERTEPEPETIAYEDYKKQQLQSRPQVTHNIRKVEGVEGMKILTKTSEDNEDKGFKGTIAWEYEESKKIQRGSKQKKMDICINYTSENRQMENSGRGRGNRGGRGNSRGNDNTSREGSGFASQSSNKEITINNDDFPDLS
jgi:plasminogen activator inhibitor 1 RNA-binding protein